LETEISHLPPPTRFPALYTASCPKIQRAATPKPRIGICRAGAPTHVNDHNRSLPEEYLPLLVTGLEDKIHFYNLWKKRSPADQSTPTSAKTFTDPTPNWQDFYDSALFIRHLDLVISVDTAVAHLAASLGRPVWLLLPYVPDWRWQRETSTSPWYPSITIFRQPAPGDWKTVLNQIRPILAAQYDFKTGTNPSETISTPGTRIS
jgi:ADP-heptose:LPS heptosyltransferase